MKKLLFILLFIPFFVNAQSDAELDNLYLRESFNLQNSGVHAITEGDTLLTLEKGKELISDSIAVINQSQWADSTSGIVYTGGNVGIGTADPLSALHINKGFGTGTGISFGNGDTEIYEVADDIIYYYINGAVRWRIDATTIRAFNPNGAGFNNVTATATTPTMSPRAGTTTKDGMGSNGDGTISLIANNIEAMRLTEDTTFIKTDVTVLRATSVASSDPVLVIGRSVTGSAGVNAHAFVDESDIDRTGTIGYASYDNRITVSGTYDYDHLAGLQAAPTYNSSGSIDRILGVTFAPTISAGTVDKVIGYKVNNGSNSGTLSKYYGFYADEELTIGTNNWFLYNAGATESYLEGNLGVGIDDPEINLHVRRDITAASAAQYYTMLIEAKSTTNIADGFGVTLDFGINDDADVTNRIVRIGGERHGADDTGKFTVLVNDAGSFGLPKLVVDENGWTGVGDIGNGDPEGVIDAVSTTGALIVPRMTTTEKNALATVNGSIVYDTTLNAFYFYENGAWVTK